MLSATSYLSGQTGRTPVIHVLTVHLYWTIRLNTYLLGLVTSLLYLIIFYLLVRYDLDRLLAHLSELFERDCSALNQRRERPWASKRQPIDFKRCCTDWLNAQGKYGSAGRAFEATALTRMRN